MIDNETLLAYSLDGLEPAERDAVREKLKDDTAAMANLAKIQQILKPFEVDRDPPKPPMDLVSATLAKLDAMPTTPKVSGRFMASRWLELALAATVGLLGFGLVASGVSRLRADAQTIACQNNLRGISNALHTYADHHQDKFPQIGVDAPAAGHFVKVLDQAGHWPSEVKTSCVDAEPVGYSYSLGHRSSEGKLMGPARKSDCAATTPVAGDFPNRNEHISGAVSPHARGQNVLFADGNVRFLTKPRLGEDNIYLNDNNQPKAGLHPKDHVLGHPEDKPE